MAGRTKASLSALVVITLLAIITTSVLASGFVGTWKATDVDGSKMELYIKSFYDKYMLSFYDSGASICGTDDAGKLYPAIGFGQGVVQGEYLKAGFTVYCLVDGAKVYWGKFGTWFKLQPDDTLLDASGVIWYLVK